MARVSLTPELKAAITKLVPKEKDKLLFRLIALKPELAAQLEYLLLEGGNTQDERRDDVRNMLESNLDAGTFSRPIHLYYTLRGLSAEITKHVKTTKDKYGDVWLNLFMINKSVERFGDACAQLKAVDQNIVNEYMVQRLKRVLKQMVALDSEYHVDFKRMRNQLGEALNKNPHFVQAASLNELNMDWLLTTDFTPDLTRLPIKPEIPDVKRPKRGWYR
jgi:hypothetical protein